MDYTIGTPSGETRYAGGGVQIVFGLLVIIQEYTNNLAFGSDGLKKGPIATTGGGGGSRWWKGAWQCC